MSPDSIDVLLDFESTCSGKRRHSDVPVEQLVGSVNEKKCRLGEEENSSQNEKRINQLPRVRDAPNSEIVLTSSGVDKSCYLPEKKKGKRRKRGQGKNRIEKFGAVADMREINKACDTESRLCEIGNSDSNTGNISIEEKQKLFTLQKSQNDKVSAALSDSSDSIINEASMMELQNRSHKQILPKLMSAEDFSYSIRRNTRDLQDSKEHDNINSHSHSKADFKGRNVMGERSNSKDRETTFMYGNYNRYYGYRNTKHEFDPRLSCLPHSLFEGKDVLDIGCNVGNITLMIAKECHPKRIVGLDIDGKLIATAKRNIRQFISRNGQKSMSSIPMTSEKFECASAVVSANHNPAFPQNVMFMQGNYVLERDDLVDLQREEYDVILALSITKWIHLNFGDDGLKRTFRRMFRQLRPDGKLVLEPQEWHSYKRKKKLTATIFENFKNIKFRPDQFQSYLLSPEIGFSSCELLGIPNNSSKGFQRSLLLFTKSSSHHIEQQEDKMPLSSTLSSLSDDIEVHRSPAGVKSLLCNDLASAVRCCDAATSDSIAGDSQTQDNR